MKTKASNDYKAEGKNTKMVLFEEDFSLRSAISSVVLQDELRTTKVADELA